jgi:hypothetical protein
MPRGRRRAAPDIAALERELEQLKERQAQLRQQMRQLRGGGGIRTLETKLEKQLATAKWTVQQIKELRPDWDEVGFYQSVQAVQPKPRGRRPRQQAQAEASS